MTTTEIDVTDPDNWGFVGDENRNPLSVGDQFEFTYGAGHSSLVLLWVEAPESEDHEGHVYYADPGDPGDWADSEHYKLRELTARSRRPPFGPDRLTVAYDTIEAEHGPQEWVTAARAALNQNGAG